MHLLIATDGSELAVDAAHHAAGFFKQPDHVTLLNVLTRVPGENVDELDVPASSPEEQARQWEIAIREAEHAFARTSAVIVAASVDSRVEAGDVAWTIARVAQEIGADVIVVSAHMRHKLGRWIHRSIAQRVVRDAPCAVFVVPGPAPKQASSQAMPHTQAVGGRAPTARGEGS
jgi:nucleotide-binding universal stress UspA family protein